MNLAIPGTIYRPHSKNPPLIPEGSCCNIQRVSYSLYLVRMLLWRP